MVPFVYSAKRLNPLIEKPKAYFFTIYRMACEWMLSSILKKVESKPPFE